MSGEKRSAYEVLRITKEDSYDESAQHERVVTMWDKAHAELLASVINGKAGRDIYNGYITRRVVATISEHEVTYRDDGKRKVSVPACFIASDMNEAFDLIVLGI